MTEPIDAATFRALQDSTGREFVAELVGTFLEEAPGLLGQMRTALAAADADGLRRAAHSLKSNALAFGANALAERARGVELGGLAAAAGGGSLADLEAEFTRARAALERLRDA